MEFPCTVARDPPIHPPRHQFRSVAPIYSPSKTRMQKCGPWVQHFLYVQPYCVAWLCCSNGFTCFVFFLLAQFRPFGTRPGPRESQQPRRCEAWMGYFVATDAVLLLKQGGHQPRTIFHDSLLWSRPWLPCKSCSVQRLLCVRASVCKRIFVSKLLCVSVRLCVCAYVCLSVHLSACLPAWLSVCLSVCLPVCLSVCLSIFLPIYLPIYPSIFLSTYFFPIQSSSAPTIPSHPLRLITVGRLKMSGCLVLCLPEWFRWLQWSPRPQLLDVVGVVQLQL